MIDLPNDEDVIAMMIYRPKEVLLASDDGRGFITMTDDLVAQVGTGDKS